MQVIEFIANDNPAAAKRILESLQARAASLGSMAERGREVPELRDDVTRCPRELIVRPWRMIYVIKGDAVHVTALLDSRRDVAALLRDRFARGGRRA